MVGHTKECVHHTSLPLIPGIDVDVRRIWSKRDTFHTFRAKSPPRNITLIELRIYNKFTDLKCKTLTETFKHLKKMKIVFSFAFFFFFCQTLLVPEVILIFKRDYYHKKKTANVPVEARGAPNGTVAFLNELLLCHHLSAGYMFITKL